MNKEMMNLAEWSLKMVKDAGADDASVYLSKERFVHISYRDQKPETIKEALQKGLFVEIFVNGRYSGQSSSDLRKEPLKKFISNAVETTRLLAKDEFRTLPDPKLYEGRAKIDLKINDKSQSDITPEQRHANAKAIEKACIEKGGEKVISVTSERYDGNREAVAITSNGFLGGKKSTIFWSGAEMSIKDEGDRRPSGWHYIAARLQSQMPSAENIGATAADRTLSLLGARKIKTETLPVIVENRNASRVMGGLLSAMNGGNIQQKRSFLADMLGKQIGSKLLTIVDDPLLISGLGSRLYDGDGFATKPRTVVEQGVLKEFYIDWYYSRKLGTTPTTGSSSNLILPPGKRSVKQIMKDLGRGIYITGFLGGNSNSTTGDFSVGIIGHLFENGEPTQAIAEMNIADNHLKFWNKLIEAANDPWTYSSNQMPSLVFEDIVVSGT